MSVSEWKRVNLFDLLLCVDYEKHINIKAQITAECFNSTYKIIGDASGRVHVYFHNWDSISFPTFCGPIKLCTIANDSNLLVNLYENDGSVLIHIYNLQKLSKRSGAPCIGTARLVMSSEPTIVKSYHLDTQFCILVGFQKGDIFLHRAPINRDLTPNFVRFNVSTTAITGIEVNRRSEVLYDLFVTSYSGIYHFILTDNNIVGETKVLLESTKCAYRCSTLYIRNSNEAYIVVGHDDALYCYTRDGRGPCYAIEGTKKIISQFGNNLVVVIEIQISSFSSSAQSKLILIDVQNNMIVFSKLLDSITNLVFDAYNSFVRTQGNKMYILRERDMNNKLRILTEKNLYDIALRLLEFNGGDEDSIAYINKQYGDYLFFKGDYNAAVEKYIKTIGHVESYTVIEKLLISRQNLHLCQYLNALIKTEVVTEEHSELLKKCNERLELKMEKSSSNKTNGDISLIKYGRMSNDKLIPFLNTIHDQEEIYCFFNEMKEVCISTFIMENSHSLIGSCANEISNALKSLYINYKIQYPERFIPFFLNNINNCIDFLEYIVSCNIRDKKSTLIILLFELYLRKWHNGEKNSHKIMHFLENEVNSSTVENILLICKNYSFWEGITYILMKYMCNRLCIRYFVQGSDYQNWNKYSNKYIDANLHIWLNFLITKENVSDHSVRFTNMLIGRMLKEKNDLVQFLSYMLLNKSLQASHINEFFTEEHSTFLITKKKRKELNKLLEEIYSLRKFVTNYCHKSIEFRSNICNICKERLSLPAVYFLCQHSFHKNCLNLFSNYNLCTTCSGNKKYKNNCTARTEIHLSEKINNLKNCKTVMESLAMIIGDNVFETVENKQQFLQNFEIQTVLSSSVNDQTKCTQWAGRFSTSETLIKPAIIKKEYNAINNPFENEDVATFEEKKEYDANLNPFNI